MPKALFVTMEFWPFKGGVARLYKNFCDEWEDVVVYVHEDKRKPHFSEFLISNFKFLNKSQIPNPKSQTNSNDKNSNDRNIGEIKNKGVGYEVIRKPFFWKFIWPHWGKLLVDLFFYIRTHKPSIVFVGQILPVGTAVYLLSKLFNFEYVVFVHGLDVQWAARGNPVKRYLARKVLCSARRIISNSEYTRQLTSEALYPCGEQTMLLFPKPYVRPHELSPVFDHYAFFLHTFGIFVDKNLPIVLSAARLVPRKGFDDLIALAKEFKGKATVIIFGKGPDEDRLRGLIAEHDVGETVHLLTKELTDDDMERLYRSCDVFVFLPKELEGGDVEGFGQVALEAQSFGKPVIIRDSGGAGESLVDGETGYLWKDGSLVTLKSYLVTLLDSKELREQMGEKGKIHAAKFASRFHQTVQGLKHSLTEQSKKVSIIIPVGYDVSRIVPTLKSIEGQTYKNIEVIIVGDGIPIEELPMSNYQLPITTLKISKSGAAAARNAGARRATGEYLLFVDDDTVLREDCVEKMVRRFEVDKFSTAELGSRRNIGTGLADSPKGSFVPSSARPSSNRPQYENSQPLTLAGEEISFVYSGFYFGWKAMPAVKFNIETARQNPYIDTTSMIRREAFPGFDESLKRLQDWDLFLTILDRGGKGEAIHEYLYRKSARLFKNLLKWKGISFWFPKFVWKLPVAKRVYNLLPPVRRYNKSLRIVKEKHGV